jgi:protein-arginine kinase activator protein McsA
MYKYANQTEFEKAAYCRDKIKELKRKLIEV